jgi:hypothetical protein
MRTMASRSSIGSFSSCTARRAYLEILASRTELIEREIAKLEWALDNEQGAASRPDVGSRTRPTRP